MSETRDEVSVQIDELLLGLPSSPCRPSIFRVHDDIRCLNARLYDSKAVSIGPFHHGKDHLRKMQQHKLRYLKLLLKRRKETSVDRYVMAIRSVEEKARKCYGDRIEFSSNEFVEMLVVDGCFIVELIRKYGDEELRERDDPIFQYEQVLSQLRHDLMLAENQVPFFVLNQLFSMTKTGNPDDDIVDLVQLFLEDVSPWPDALEAPGRVSAKDVDHLLGLMYKTWSSSFAKIMSTRRPAQVLEGKALAINSATELQDAGIKIEKDTRGNCLDIKFTKKVLRIPCFNVSDETETILRNMITYEHFFIDSHPKYVTDYAYFLHCLINSPKDVETLRLCGILSNLLGDDDMVYHMFNRLGRNILMSSDFSYTDIFDRVYEHCRHRRYTWWTDMKRNNFKNPCAYVAFFAGLWLILLTMVQTAFAVVACINVSTQSLIPPFSSSSLASL